MFVNGHLPSNLSNDLFIVIKVVALGTASHGFNDELAVCVRVPRLALDAIGVLLFEQSNAFAVPESDALDKFPDILVVVVLLDPNPFILDIDGFPLLVGAVNRPLVYVKRLEILYDDVGDAIDISNLAHLLQIRQLKLDGLHKFVNVHCIFAVLVQKHLQIEGLVIGIDCIYGIVYDTVFAHI